MGHPTGRRRFERWSEHEPRTSDHLQSVRLLRIFAIIDLFEMGDRFSADARSSLAPLYLNEAPEEIDAD